MRVLYIYSTIISKI